MASIVLGLNFIVFTGIVLWMAWRDKMRKLTVSFFEPDEATRSAYDRVVGSFRTAAKVVKLQAIGETATYDDTKYTAGASQGDKLGKATFMVGQVPGVIANVGVPIF